MRKVYYFPGPAVVQPFTISTHDGAEALHLGERWNEAKGKHVLTVWAEVETEEQHADMELLVAATGQEIPNGYAYICTHQESGGLVWHLYQK